MIKMLGKKNNKPSSRQPRLDNSYRAQPVFSYRAARQESDRQFERGTKPINKSGQLKRKLAKLTYFIPMLAILASLIYSLTLTSNAQIETVGGQAMLRSNEIYQDAINKHLNSSISNRTKITIDIAQLKNKLAQQFPEIDQISVRLPLLRHQPIVSLTMAEPVVRLATSETTYVLEGSGRAMFDEKTAQPEFNTASLPVITDLSGQPITLGKPALTRHQIAYASLIAGQSDTKQLPRDTMTLQAGGEELHIRFKGLSYTVKFSFGADARQSFGAFLATKEKLEQDKQTIGEYIDVRIPDRVYTK